MIVLHPRGSWLRYDESGRIYLASVGHQPLADLEVSNTMARHLQSTQVLVHGGEHGSSPPSENDLATALIVNHTPGSALSLPRSVRLYVDGPLSTLHCDLTQPEWDDFEREVDRGLYLPEILNGLQRRRTTIYFTPEGVEEINDGKSQLRR